MKTEILTPHVFQTNSCGGSVCENCGDWGRVPQWPPYCNQKLLKLEHLEPTAEARAEWIKVFAMLMVNENDKRIATIQMHCLMDRMDEMHYANKDLVDENKKMRMALIEIRGETADNPINVYRPPVIIASEALSSLLP